MKIIFTIFVKQLSKRSNESASYKLWHLLSTRSIHHIVQENNAMRVTAKHININAFKWYKPQLTLWWKAAFVLSFLQWQSLKIHWQLLLLSVRIKKIQASALVISQTGQYCVGDSTLKIPARTCYGHSVAVERFAGSSTTCTVNQALKSPHA